MQSNIITALLVAGNVFASTILAQAQPSEPRMNKTDYISQYSDQAIREMHSSGVPASITLAQGMLESDYGNSPLAKYAKNHFGIKCHSGWDGPSFIQDDDEKNECFRKYYSVYDSYRDHSEFLSTRDRYNFLFDLKPTDYKGWARGLKKAGYATNPKYADLLIRIIEENELHQYDKVTKIPDSEPLVEMEMAQENERKQEATILSVRNVEVSDNNIKYVIASQGDTPKQIAEKHEMGVWQILKYNDLSKGDFFIPGEVVYLQPKRNNSATEFHSVKSGETIRDISQRYGVKINRIEKLNGLTQGQKLEAGQHLRLKSDSWFVRFFTGG